MDKGAIFGLSASIQEKSLHYEIQKLGTNWFKGMAKLAELYTVL